MKTLLIGEVLKTRSFNGANKALPVLASSLYNAGFGRPIQLDLELPNFCGDDILREATDADLIAFVGALTVQWPEIDETAKMIFEHLQLLGREYVPLLVGGYATKNVENIAKVTPWITAYFNGEGEEGIVEIARAIERGTFHQNMRSIRGMCFVEPDGEFHFSIASRVKSLDAIDQNFDFVHVPSIHDMDIFASRDGRQLKTAQLFTQRGCPWHCSFCNKSTEGSNVTRLGEESFRNQLRYLKESGYEAVYLDVDTFTVNEKIARREARILNEEGFRWGSNTRIDTVDLDLLTYLVQHGCIYMFFGVEHVVPEVLIAVEKFNGPVQRQLVQAEAYVARVEQVFRHMDAVGLPSSFFLILGLPKAKLNEGRNAILGYEPASFEDDMAAVRFGLESCSPDFLNFNILRFMPGSIAADMLYHPAYSCVRPSGEQPITAGHFLPRVAALYGYKVPKNHGVYRLCESIGMNQPTTTVMDPERIYQTLKSTMILINARIDAGKKATHLFIDRDVLAAGLVKQDEFGRYTIAPLNAFEAFSA